MDTNTLKFDIHALHMQEQTFIMQRMDFVSLRKFILASPRAKYIFRHTFDTFVEVSWRKFPNITRNNELTQIVYRVLAVHFEPVKPWSGRYLAQYRKLFTHWIAEFRRATETSPLPEIPVKDRNVDTIAFLCNDAHICIYHPEHCF